MAKYWLNICAIVLCILQVYGFDGYVTLIDDGPTAQGGSVTFRADLHNYDDTRPLGLFKYEWKDNGVPGHRYETPETKNTTSIWKVEYPVDEYPAGEYSVQVVVSQFHYILWVVEAKQRKTFEITSLSNGTSSRTRSNLKL